MTMENIIPNPNMSYTKWKEDPISQYLFEAFVNRKAELEYIILDSHLNSSQAISHVSELKGQLQLVNWFLEDGVLTDLLVDN